MMDKSVFWKLVLFLDINESIKQKNTEYVPKCCSHFAKTRIFFSPGFLGFTCGAMPPWNPEAQASFLGHLWYLGWEKISQKNPKSWSGFWGVFLHLVDSYLPCVGGVTFPTRQAGCNCPTVRYVDLLEFLVCFKMINLHFFDHQHHGIGIYTSCLLHVLVLDVDVDYHLARKIARFRMFSMEHGSETQKRVSFHVQFPPLSLEEMAWNLYKLFPRKGCCHSYSIFCTWGIHKEVFLDTIGISFWLLVFLEWIPIKGFCWEMKCFSLDEACSNHEILVD